MSASPASTTPSVDDCDAAIARCTGAPGVEPLEDTPRPDGERGDLPESRA